MVTQTIADALRRVAFALIVLACTTSALPDEPNRIAGTYSSLTLSKDAGDLLGYEVRIIPVRQGFKAVIQIAEGGAGDVYLVDVAGSAAALSFDVPVTGGQPGKFVGKVSD